MVRMVIQSAGRKSSYGIGGSGQLSPIQQLFINAVENQIGDYHSLKNTQPWSISPQQTSFNLLDYPIGSHTNPDDYATVPFEPLAQSKAEMVAVLSNYYNLTQGGNVVHTWYRDIDKKVLFQATITVPDPKSQGYDYWKWYSTASWMGRFPPDELIQAGYYFVVITSPWGNVTIDFSITCPSYWKCEQPLNGYESDSCGNRRLNPTCNPYAEAQLISCSAPASAVIGQAVTVVLTIKQGTVTENYKAIFSGAYVGTSTAFSIPAGTGLITQNVSDITFHTAGTNQVGISLVKV